MNHTPHGNGPPSAGMGQGQGQQHAHQPAQGSNSSAPAQNLNSIVIEYLIKKGYTLTEQTLRHESSNVDREGRPIVKRAEDHGTIKYSIALNLLVDWVENNLATWKPELQRLLWPVFVYSFIELITSGRAEDGHAFLDQFRPRFEEIHKDELRIFDTVNLPAHVTENSTMRLYKNSKYKIPLNTTVYYQVLTFMETKHKEGGSVVLHLLSTYCEIATTTQGPMDQFSFEAIIKRYQEGNSMEEQLEEGIPGTFTGTSLKDVVNNSAPVKLGMMAMEPDLALDVRAELEDEDTKNPNLPDFGKGTYVEEFDRTIKREESSDAPTRSDIPLPPSRARDVIMEVRKIKEHRDRFKIESRTGGTGTNVSIVMFTFHNTYDQLTCIEFGGDNDIVAAGTLDSYIHVWNLQGNPLPSILPEGTDPHKDANTRRLIGHSAPCYSVAFSPAIGPDSGASASGPSTSPQYLISCSSDGSIRLWSLQTWTCLCTYRGHDRAVWNVEWSPFGHYFATCGWDKTVRVWSQDHKSYLRMMVGHDDSVSHVSWHPNGAYIFSASDDKTVRMWSFVTGECVRVFTGHTKPISALQCSNNGKILASADDGGSIILWDLQKGKQIKRCRGHGPGGIYSLSWNVESTVLASGGADGTVRVWDVELPADPFKDGPEAAGTAGTVVAPNTATGPQPAAAGVGGKKTKKEILITPDQIAAFPTKKTPVFKVFFTRMNLVMAAGPNQG